MDWPGSETTFVTGFRANPGNNSIVHHVIAFLAPPETAAQYQALADADPSHAYVCFGGPHDPPGARPAGWLGAWAPGSLGMDFPDGTGIKVRPGSKIVLQVHYNVQNLQAITADQTSIDLKLDSSVTREAMILPWTNPDWVTNRSMPIPAGQPDVMHDFSFNPSPYMSALTNNVIPSSTPYQIHGALLHMHTRGTRGTLEIRRSDNTTECLLQIPHWNFHWQGSYMFVQPKTARAGDKLALECHWDNSEGNQPIVNGVRQAPQDLNWGEGTNDEMCLGGFFLTR
jgi:hypothetical protein